MQAAATSIDAGIARATSRPARLVVDGDTPRALELASVAPGRDATGAIAIWYDVVGPPLPAAARARVVIEAAP